jgi:hypothetical protein
MLDSRLTEAAIARDRTIAARWLKFGAGLRGDRNGGHV